MLASRFWYVILALLLGGALFLLNLASSMYNRSGQKFLDEGLQSDAQVVSWYLRNDARERSGQLIKFALDGDIAKHLDKASKAEGKIPDESREKVRAALRKVNDKIPKEQKFDAVFAVDQHGRVVAHLGYEQASGMKDFELGGYPVVADALHGYIRDDTLQLDRLYRVVARPVEFDVGQLPAGAVIGARIIDEKFARSLSKRTGAAVAFYMDGARTASAAPEAFDKSQLDHVNRDLGKVADEDEDYKTKGRSSARTLGQGSVRVVYTRLPGEARELGAGYVVARTPVEVKGPFGLGFFSNADDKDQEAAGLPLVLVLVLVAMVLGIGFTFIEHTRPILAFKNEAIKLSKGEVDQLQPSKFRGIFRKVASDVNDGIDAVIAKGGGSPRRAADLGKVLGDLPAEPQMSAFSFPGDPSSAPAPSSAPVPSQPKPSAPLPEAPKAKKLPTPPKAKSGLEQTQTSPSAGDGDKKLPKPPPRAGAPAPPSPPKKADAASGAAAGDDQEPEWRKVYEDFVATKNECGEKTEGFTYEKFEQTLKKNRDALMKRHNCKRVKFSVYVKEGKAALKASPIKE